MVFLSFVFAATVAVAPGKAEPQEVHYYPEKVKPVIHSKSTPTQVCPLGKKANYKEEQVCLNCEDGLTYIDPWCYKCPEGARVAHIRRRAVNPNEQVRCIMKGTDVDKKRWKEMPKLVLSSPKKKEPTKKPVKKKN